MTRLRNYKTVLVAAFAAATLIGCSGGDVGVPGGANLNSPEEQKKVQDHYKEMADSGRGPGSGETGPPGGKL